MNDGSYHISRQPGKTGWGGWDCKGHADPRGRNHLEALALDTGVEGSTPSSSTIRSGVEIAGRNANVRIEI